MNDATPNARRLSALLDGRLSDDERRRLLDELGESDEALGTYADAAALLRELEDEGLVAPPARAASDTPAADTPTPHVPPVNTPTPAPVLGAADVVPIESARQRTRAAAPRRRLVPWAALAAGIAVVASLGVYWQREHTPPPRDFARAGGPSYVALLAPRVGRGGLPPGWDGTPWRTTRGAGDPLTPEARAVRVGARLTDLELAAGARDTAAGAIAAEVAALIDELPGGGGAADEFRSIATQTRAGGAVDADQLARARADAARLAGEEVVAFAAWVEAARVAAARRDAAFFGSEATQSALRRAPTPGRALNTLPEVLARVRAAAAQRPPAWDVLDGELASLLRAYGS